MERKPATECEAEALRIQEQMAKAEARVKVFEMMDQWSTKSEADLMKRKNSKIQSRAIERDICDDLLYQQHHQHLVHPRTQLLNEGQRRSVDYKSSLCQEEETKHLVVKEAQLKFHMFCANY